MVQSRVAVVLLLPTAMALSAPSDGQSVSANLPGSDDAGPADTRSPHQRQLADYEAASAAYRAAVEAARQEEARYRKGLAEWPSGPIKASGAVPPAVPLRRVPTAALPEGEGAAAPPEKRICRMFTSTGSLIKQERVCRTEREWQSGRDKINGAEGGISRSYSCSNQLECK